MKLFGYWWCGNKLTDKPLHTLDQIFLAFVFVFVCYCLSPLILLLLKSKNEFHNDGKELKFNTKKQDASRSLFVYVEDTSNVNSTDSTNFIKSYQLRIFIEDGSLGGGNSLK